MERNATVEEQRRLAREVIQMLDSVFDSRNLTGNELVEFDLPATRFSRT
jgi:hypothetical protein